MVKISNLTELTATASADKVAVDDASASQTKYVSIKNLTGHGYGQIHHVSQDSGGSASTITTPTTYTDLNFSTDGEGAGATVDSTVNSITLPSTGGLFFLQFSATLASSVGSSQVVYLRLYDGSALIPGSERSFQSAGANVPAEMSCAVVYSSSGSEAITAQVKASSGNVSMGGGVLTVTPIPASA